MLLVGRAREQRARPAAEIPASGEREQPAANEVRGEVLTRDRRLVVLPPLPDAAHHRQQDVTERALDGERRQRAVERRLSGDVVQGLEGGGQIDGEPLRRSDATRCRLVEREARRLGRRDAAPEVLLHRSHARDVVVGVQPKTAFGAPGSKQRVAPLPGPQRGLRNARPPGQLADPQVAAHPRSVQTLDRHLTNLDRPGTFPLQNLDKGGRSCVPPIYLQQRSSSSAP